MEKGPKSDNKIGDVQSVSEKDHVYVLDVDNAKLAELGYKSEFKREFSLLETCAFSFSIMVRNAMPCVCATSSAANQPGHRRFYNFDAFIRAGQRSVF